ncbi:hypothetical protein AcW1_009493 [Taiwanofungus camphoratus]|nr:hypothetical protein AcW1_009493 [Antrodia cinnamomea]
MSSSTAMDKVSFTIRRPTPISRPSSSGTDSDASFKAPALPRHLASASAPGSPLARSAPASPKPAARTHAPRDSSDDDNDDEDEAPADELVTAFDQFGAQRLHEKPRGPQGPLVIPALKNRDWRDLTRKRKQLYVPPSAAATGADGSVGGLGTRDTINAGPQAVGLQVKKRVKLEESAEAMTVVEESAEAVEVEVEERVKKEDEETDDQKALRAILAGAASADDPAIAAIPTTSEDDAYRQDVAELPEPATLADYERVPVAQFGAALLRGMGWKEGAPATRDAKTAARAAVEPWLPQARPALLGIGAKEKEALDDGRGVGKKGGRKARPDKKYIPLVKKERAREEGDERSASGRRSLSSEQRSSTRGRHSRSPTPERRRDRYRRGTEYDRDRDRRRGDSRDYDSGARRDRDRDRERDRRRDRSADRYDSDGRRMERDRRAH